MAAFVVDASAALPWCFADEATDWTKAILIRVRSGEQIIVPAHWTIEVANALLFAVRKKRIPKQEAIEFLDDLNVLPIEVDPTPDPAGAANILSVAEKHRLTAYDATYLELAIRRKLALATLDADLKMAARAESLVLL